MQQLLFFYVDLAEYWEKRGKTFSDELTDQPIYVQKYLSNQESQILKFLNKLNFENILEIGCGTGRLTKQISNLSKIKKYLAIDISEDLMSIAKKQLENSEINFQCINLLEFKTNENFDLVFSCEVLQHIAPDKIESIIKKLLSFSKHKLIFVETYSEEEIGNSKDEYFFVHDYEKIFSKLNIDYKIKKISLPISLIFLDKYIKMRNRTSFGKQVIFELTV
jgi:2-polyprenyl-3-methyl-5-hydroxy-6-metoxy-1,4-benzoquinol methylase